MKNSTAVVVVVTNRRQYTSIRCCISCMMCLLVTSLALMRSNLSVAIICMIRNNHINVTDNNTTNQSTSSHDYCRLLNSAHLNDYDGDLDWSSGEVSIVLSSMFWGGLCTGIFSGWAADRYGPKLLLLIATVIHVIGSMISPIAAVHTGYIGLTIVRFIMGFGQGVSIPCMGSLMARWYPANERSTVIAIYTSGNQFGSMIAYPIGAFLCRSHTFMGGWPAIFYVFGIMGFFCCILWYLLVTNTPDKNRFISRDELGYIRDQLKDQSLISRKSATDLIPWCKMFASSAIFAQMCMNLSAACFMSLYQSYLPTYFKQVLAMDIKQNGLLSTVPFIVQLTIKMFVSTLADWTKRRQLMNPTTVCKLFNSIGAFGAALSLLLLGFLDCRHTALAITLVCISFACFANFAPGFLTSGMCIAPVYTGIVSSFQRTSAQIGQILGPALVGLLVHDGTQNEWQRVHLVLSVLLASGGLLYCLFGSAEIQTWAKQPSSPTQLSSLMKTTDETIDDEQNNRILSTTRKPIIIESR